MMKKQKGLSSFREAYQKAIDKKNTPQIIAVDCGKEYAKSLEDSRKLNYKNRFVFIDESLMETEKISNNEVFVDIHENSDINTENDIFNFDGLNLQVAKRY